MDQSAGVVLLIRWAASNILKNVILNLDQDGWTHRDRLHPNFTHSDCLTNTRNWEGIVDGLSQAICNELNLFRDYTARPLSKNHVLCDLCVGILTIFTHSSLSCMRQSNPSSRRRRKSRHGLGFVSSAIEEVVLAKG